MWSIFMFWGLNESKLTDNTLVKGTFICCWWNTHLDKVHMLVCGSYYQFGICCLSWEERVWSRALASHILIPLLWRTWIRRYQKTVSHENFYYVGKENKCFIKPNVLMLVVSHENPKTCIEWKTLKLPPCRIELQTSSLQDWRSTTEL